MSRLDSKVAEAFCHARAAAQSISEFPGELPRDLAEAYAVQALAIEIWDDAVSGWKVGRIAGDNAARFGEDRLLGPVFAETVANLEDGVAFPAITGGFAALEAELIAVIDRPIGANEIPSDPLDCLGLVRHWNVGFEAAGSPLASIGDSGPLATIAGFGNNLALLVGPQVDVDDPDRVECTVTIGQLAVGPVEAGQLPGGPLGALHFALRKLAALGNAIEGGMLVSTGAITGVHRVEIGQICHADFSPGGRLNCIVTDATALR